MYQVLPSGSSQASNRTTYAHVTALGLEPASGIVSLYVWYKSKINMTLLDTVHQLIAAVLFHKKERNTNITSLHLQTIHMTLFKPQVVKIFIINNNKFYL
jgi:hypothetical protein